MSMKTVTVFFATAVLLAGLDACSHTTKKSDPGAASDKTDDK